MIVPHESSEKSQRTQNATVDVDTRPPRTRTRNTIVATQEGTTAANNPDAAATNSIVREFEQTIQSGDWAAVRTTAALLSKMSEDTTADSTGGAVAAAPPIHNFDVMNPLQAAELDQLVAEGNWEGVVFAAAKYEAQEGYESSNDQNVAPDPETVTAMTHSVLTNPAGETNPHTNPTLVATKSKISTHKKYHQQTKELIAQVVPEEIDYVDEILVHFRGREDDLLDTLRTMQEHTQAQNVTDDDRNYLINCQVEPNSAKNNNDNNNNDHTPNRYNVTAAQTATETKTTTIPTVPRSTTPTKLESRSISFSEKSMNDAIEKCDNLVEAIKAGDWDAVILAATAIGDNDAAEVLSLQSKPSTSGNAPSNDRARELNDLIDLGDWAGIVTAASQFIEADRIRDEYEEEQKLQRLIRLMEAEDAFLKSSGSE